MYAHNVASNLKMHNNHAAVLNANVKFKRPLPIDMLLGST